AGAERPKRPRLDHACGAAGQEGDRVGALEGPPGAAAQGDVPGRHVGDLGVLLQPAHQEVVNADDAGVGSGALAEVDFAVGSEGELVVVVVAEAGQPGHQVAQPAALPDRNFATVGNVEPAGEPEDVVDGRVELIDDDLGANGRPGRDEAQDAGRGRRVAGAS